MLQKERDILCFSPAQSVQKAYLRLPIKEKDKDEFRSSMSTLLHNLDPSDREGVNKGYVKTFLETTFWNPTQYKVGERDDIDLAITDKNTDSVAVMFEFKRVGEEGMVKKDNLNRKGMQELVLYYILQEKVKHNHNVRHLIISDGFQYFIFEKGEFWKNFASDNKFVNEVLAEENDKHVTRDYIYKQIIAPKVEEVWHRLKFIYLDLKQYIDQVDDEKFNNSRALNAIYKLFSPTYMLNKSFQKHYGINKSFYRELLYIMGLQEVYDNDRRRIKRIPEGQRSCGSLVEQTYSLLEDFMPTEEQEEKRLEIALGLVMLWVNRIIFIRLLETQLINFNNGDNSYGILGKIDNFDTLYRLFFNVLAIPEKERTKKLATQFSNVPYLNSSLFELSDVEKKYFSVNALSNKMLQVMKGTVLKDNKGHAETAQLHVLDYLLRFLNAYDFGANHDNEGKTLISAAVLGLIFEKVNGYKDGSYYTSEDVTADMCHNVIRRAVVAKFNEHYGWNCETFDDLKEKFDYSKPENRDTANKLINSIRICDPSVGSGHFLVASLNEFIVIKRELNVLCAEDGSRMKAYRIAVENDELVITDEDDEFHYQPGNPESQKVQETLFKEKRKIIENCLFGVDINAKSVEICQLRLWIELLKSAYYYKGKDDGLRHLQTLPNIDINIKTGNSLVMQQKLDTNLCDILSEVHLSIDKYRNNVANYKKSATKADKHKMNEDIKNIKSTIQSEFYRRSQTYKDWIKVYAKLLYETNDLFADNGATAKLTALRNKEQKLRLRLEAIKNDKVLNDAFEWRYEFPEILNEEGKFIGFDIVIGNPPYGVKISGEYRKRVEDNWGHMPDYEIYYYFIKLAQAIVKPGGYLSYIIPNTWLFNVHAEDVRKNLLLHWHILEVLDCTEFSLFDKATVRNTIITMQRYPSPIDETTAESASVGYRSTKGLLEESKTNNSKPFNTLVNRPLMHTSGRSLMTSFSQNWALAFRLTEQEKDIVEAIEINKGKVKTYFEVSQGYIPYRLSDLVQKYGKEEGNRIKNERQWHSKTKVDDSYIQEIKGEDITKYHYHATGEYVKYGKHVGTYVDMKYFSSPRLLVREIVNPLIACYTEETFVNDPQLIDVISRPGNKTWSLKFLWAIMNSKMGSYYIIRHSPKATKGAFPKILIADINDFPLPVIDTDDKKAMVSNIEALVEDVTGKARNGYENSEEVKTIENKINMLVCQLYGLGNDEAKIINR